MNVGHHLLLPVKADGAIRKEFHEIFTKAAQTPAVRAAYAVDYCEPQTVTFDSLDKFFTFHTGYWRKLASGIKIN